MREKLLGAWGEARAAEYLEKKGYRILSRGYQTRFGEIDLIAADAKFLAFVEVKTRKDDDFAEAWESVGARKRARIRRTAEIWLYVYPAELQPRFDVIEVYAPAGVRTKNPEIRHWEDAFQ